MVEYIGTLDRAGINALYADSRAGIVLYQPARNHYESQPIKLFEFMAAGLPVVASGFPLWRKLVEGSGCGLCVDPTDPEAVRAACLRLLDDPALARSMGEKGREAVTAGYNWSVEEKKLFELYDSL